MTKGKRVQIYIPADLAKKWDALPRYERSAEVAKALRAWWEAKERGRPKHAADAAGE